MYVRGVGLINNNIERFLLHSILWSFGVLALLYMVFLANMVKNIIERRSFEAEARSLSTEVGKLELSYLSMSNNVDLVLSYSMGFKEVKAKFATRKALSLVPLSKTGTITVIQNDF